MLSWLNGISQAGFTFTGWFEKNATLYNQGEPAHLVENSWIFGLSEFVSVYVERDKKNLKNFIFALAPLRIWSIFRRSRFLVREWYPSIILPYDLRPRG